MKLFSISFFFVFLLAACGGSNGLINPVLPLPAPLLPGEVSIPAVKYPIPKNLWEPPSGATPSSGNYIFLQSDSGDYVGGGKTYTYTNANAEIGIVKGELSISVNINGNEKWTGRFELPSAATNLQAGYFPNLTGSFDKAKGSLDWYVDRRGCGNNTSWFVVDRIIMNGTEMTGLDVRFEQRCGSPSLRGQIHWNKADVNRGYLTTPPPPVPAGLWEPPAGATPAIGNYFYMESTRPNLFFLGKSLLYTQANAIITPKFTGALLELDIAGDVRWTGNFFGIKGLNQLVAGYYSGLMRYPFGNPVLPGIDLYSELRGCNDASGWFTVDDVVLTAGKISALDLRFEFYCSSYFPNETVHGKFHWTANDTTTPPGPQDPPPTGLWTPSPSFVKPGGNYIYFVSDTGDLIGAGRTELLTSGNSVISVNTNGNAALEIYAGGWKGNFVGMNSLTQLQPGYYGNLQRYPYAYNVTRGGIQWWNYGNDPDPYGLGCPTLAGWFVVDSVKYSFGALAAIDLRFEEVCNGSTSAIHGAIHWVR